MATHLTSSNNADEDYIDMEVSCSSSSSSSSTTTNFLCYTINSPPKTIEFEFQKSSNPNEAKPTPSPADELFYKGKLLPLHLPPRLQMVQNLLQNSTSTTFQKPFGSYGNTPLESCNISPSESCRVSCELNPDEYFFEWSTELSGFISDNNPKKHSWSKKLKLIKQSILAQKLKASTAYLKTLFTKSVCSNEAGNDSKDEEYLNNKYMKVETKKIPIGEIGKGAYPITLAAVMAEESVNTHRKSFSGAIKRHYSATKSSSSSSSSGASSLSSSFSISSNGLYDLQLLKKSSSANSELEEASIEGAIAHCKKSQQMFISSNKTSSEVGLCSLSASRVAVSGDKER